MVAVRKEQLVSLPSGGPHHRNEKSPHSDRRRQSQHHTNKVLQILINLLSNAKYAVNHQSAGANKRITVRLERTRENHWP
jgi:hypothetical protein